ncbi:MAG: hypothetical protein IK016_03385 [Lachnospiraceae bacterium]|nr:hypothetical protein [Lachnospiraceae bacterium]
MKKTIASIVLSAVIVTSISACSGGGVNPANADSTGVSGSSDAAIVSSVEATSDAGIVSSVEAAPETPEMLDGLLVSQHKWDLCFGEEHYDALAPLTESAIAAGIKTGRQDENGNDILEYCILDYMGRVVDAPVFVGYKSYLDDDCFVITVEEDGMKYDVLCGLDCEIVDDGDMFSFVEMYSTRDEADGYRTIASYTADVIQLKKTLEPDEAGRVYTSHKYARYYGDGELGNTLAEIDGSAWMIYDAAPWGGEYLMLSSYTQFGATGGGWINFEQHPDYRNKWPGRFHIDDSYWFYAWPYAPNYGWVLLQRFENEEDENGLHEAVEMMLYNVDTEKSISLSEYAGFGTTRLRDGTRHPVSDEGLIMLCETAQEPHRHALYNVKTGEYVLTLEDGYGTITLNDRIDCVSHWMLVSNKDGSKWTYLNSKFEQMTEWFDAASSIRHSSAFVKASDGHFYGINAYGEEDAPVMEICTEPFDAEAVYALGRDCNVFALKEGDKYRLLWTE